MTAAHVEEGDKSERKLSVDQRKHRIAELHRLRMRLRNWLVEENVKSKSNFDKISTLNGTIRYISNRINYLSTKLEPVLTVDALEKEGASSTPTTEKPKNGRK